MRSRIVLFVCIVQSILFLGHALVYATCAFFWRPLAPAQLLALRVGLFLLAISFVPATLLAFRTYNWLVRVYYTAAAFWIGALNFLFLASAACWIVYAPVFLLRLPISRAAIADTLFALAALAAVYGVVNAAATRVRRIHVALPGLPPSWCGRTAAMISDTHLGHVRGRRFLARIVARLARHKPDVVFFVGDMFDGTRLDAERVAAPWKALAPPFGSYFVEGNHEEFFNTEKFLAAVSSAGMRVLRDEKVVVDGLQLVGVSFHDSGQPDRFAAILQRAAIDPARASILLLHAPRHLDVSERAGISLDLCGHTHGGQIFPSTLITHRIFGAYAYGLHPFGRMAVYTSCGAGTWGPPLRVGTRPEIVLITFD